MERDLSFLVGCAIVEPSKEVHYVSKRLASAVLLLGVLDLRVRWFLVRRPLLIRSVQVFCE